MWSNGIKIAFFPKQLLKIAQRLGTLPQDPRLSYTTSLNTSSNLDIFTFLLTFGLNSLPLVKSWSSAKPGHGFWSSVPRYLCPTKFFFRKFLMTSLHVICGLTPPSKPWLRVCLLLCSSLLSFSATESVLANVLCRLFLLILFAVTFSHKQPVLHCRGDVSRIEIKRPPTRFERRMIRWKRASQHK